MELSGENHRSIPETRNFSFYSSFSPEGKTGVGLFALSGENKKIQFDFESGRIIDPSGRYVYSYGDLGPIEISGDVETTGYSYYINNEPFAYGNIKDNFKLQKFCYDSTGMKFSLVDTEIRGTAPSYYLEFPDSFIISGYHTGYLVNSSSDLGFKVLSAKPLGDFSGFWNVTSFDKTIAPSSSGKIVVQDLSGAFLYQNNEYSLVIDTDFGNITTGVSGIANPSDFKRVHFNVTKDTSGINSTGLTNVNDVLGGGNISELPCPVTSLCTSLWSMWKGLREIFLVAPRGQFQHMPIMSQPLVILKASALFRIVFGERSTQAPLLVWLLVPALLKEVVTWEIMVILTC